MQLIIAGFHRSGTSLLAQVLHAAGLFVGDRLLEATFANPFGHYEDVEVLDLHTAILARHGLDWHVDQPFPFFVGADHRAAMADLVARRDRDHRVWGFKEPRACLFLGLWKHLAPAAKVVVVYRDPAETVRSMERRQATEFLGSVGVERSALRFFTEPDHGLRLWDSYNRALVAYVRAHETDCLVLPFAGLASGRSAAGPVVGLVNRRLGLDLDPGSVDGVFDPAATGRRVGVQRVHDPEVADRVARTWADLEELAARTGAAA